MAVVVWNRSSANFGSWPVPNMASSRTMKRRRDLGIAVLAGLEVEHEGRQRPLQPRQRPLQHDEARPRQLGRRLEVHQAQGLAKRVMVLGREVEAGQRADLAQLHIGALVRALRHVGSRQVGGGHQYALVLFADGLFFDFGSGDERFG